jgi:hypothetical protein
MLSRFTRRFWRHLLSWLNLPERSVQRSGGLVASKLPRSFLELRGLLLLRQLLWVGGALLVL